MDSNLQPKVDAHQISLDLDGLEDLLSTTVEHQVVEAQPVDEMESETILRLLRELTSVAELVNETRERLAAASERMGSMAAMIKLQAEQLELLSHYQGQATRVSGLEHKITLLKQELIRQRRPWYKKLYDVLTK
ncbi:MAG TPA: hypothetical protein V6C81_25215 [Planktothrix sp.]|jgi:hypothetical protein